MSPTTRASLTEDLRALGLSSGKILLVHASMKQVGWVCGGSVAIVQALLDVLGPAGTLVVPTHTANNRDPARWRDPNIPRAWWPTIRACLPAFDLRFTPSVGMGAVAELVRTWPGARRSSHPQTSFAALGPQAENIIGTHDLDCHLGDRSPLGRLADLGASVLLLGVGWDRCTAFHLAEYRLPEPPSWTYSCIVTMGTDREWVTYSDVKLVDDDFAELGSAFEAADHVAVGPVGNATSRLFTIQAATAFSLEWMQVHRQVPPP
jgi:aminoglycoside 3-N-acetyltransferase